MLHVILFLCIAFLFGASLCAQTRNGADTNKASCTVPQDEIAVFAAVHDEHFDNLTVLVTETEPRPLADSLNLQLAAQGRGLPLDLRMDSKEKNRFSCTIRPYVSVRHLHFISPTEERQIFHIGWNELYRRFGKHADMESFSRVGFNSDKTLALVHSSGAVGPNGSAGTLILLQRNGNKWAVKFSLQTSGV